MEYNSVTYRVTSIELGAFAYCSGLTSVSIPNTITSIGEWAFPVCTVLTSIDVVSDNSNYCSVDGVLFNKDKTTLVQYPEGKQGSYTIPNSVTSIGNGAFYHCAGLTSVTIPSSVTSIGDDAFAECTGLTSVTLPNSVTSIGGSAFDGIPNIIYNGTATGSPWGARNINGFVEGFFVYTDATKTNLVGCSLAATGEITIPNSVISIGDGAFQWCNSLMSVTIGSSVSSIGENAFGGCSGLTSINFPNSVANIGKNAFRECTGLTSVTIPNSVTSIGEYAFYGCKGLTSVIIGDGVTSIGALAFCVCSALTSITIPNSVTSIGEEAFAYCENLTTLTIDSKTFGEMAFAGCKNLASVTLGDNVASIGEWAFYNCTGLTSVTIGKNVTSIEENAFVKCYNLPSITIPDNVATIGEGAFSSCFALKNVTIGKSVTSMNEDTFFGLPELTAIIVDKNNPAFCDIDGVLYNKEKTKLICYPPVSNPKCTIPSSVLSISQYAFCFSTRISTSDYTWECTECPSLASITCEATLPPACEDELDWVYKSIPLYVPTGSVEDYKKAKGWKDFGDNIQPIQAEEVSVTDIQANPSDNNVVIEWPAITGATIYTIEIKKGSELICTLSFNEHGQLVTISFAAPSRQGNNQALQTATGWQYTISGLDPNTDYTYTVIAKKNESDTTPLYNKTIPFKTTGSATALDQVSKDKMGKCENEKIIRNGQILILRGDKTYTATGQEVK